MKHHFNLKKSVILCGLVITATALSLSGQALAKTDSKQATAQTTQEGKAENKTLQYPKAMYLSLPEHTVPPIQVHAKSWVLLDFHSGQVLASGNPDLQLAPASLTKVMSYYIVARALKTGSIKLNDEVHISRKAWRTGGSRMFIKAGDKITVEDLLHGMVVQSGNDATVALAEYVAGSEGAFVVLMNRTAKELGMKQTHFANSTGLPDIKGKTTARDLSLLVRHLIKDYPEEYKLYSKKWFTWSGIRQPNRNRLLWHFEGADGVKTGYTKDAGYCLISSAKKGDMRLISVVMGGKSEKSRIDESKKLLTYGFRFFEDQLLYKKDQVVAVPKVWLSSSKTVELGLKDDLYLTVPYGERKSLSATMKVNPYLQAPIEKGKPYGTLVISFKGKPILEKPLVALTEAPKGGAWTRFSGHMSLFFHKLFG